METAELDLKVAEKLGIKASIEICDDGGGNGEMYQCLDIKEHRWFNPSTDWSQGGPLIEEHNISIDCVSQHDYIAVVGESFGTIGGVDGVTCDGPTPLIAAMKALVAGKDE